MPPGIPVGNAMPSPQPERGREMDRPNAGSAPTSLPSGSPVYTRGEWHLLLLTSCRVERNCSAEKSHHSQSCQRSAHSWVRASKMYAWLEILHPKAIVRRTLPVDAAGRQLMSVPKRSGFASTWWRAVRRTGRVRCRGCRGSPTFPGNGIRVCPAGSLERFDWQPEFVDEVEGNHHG